jgi:hypothetical protein
MMVLGREITEPIDLVVGLPPGEKEALSAPQYVLDLREKFETGHAIAREALGKSTQRAKKEYDKLVHKRQYQIGDPVWYLVKGTQRVRDKVRKFLPNYDGPYFVLGHIDDLVYAIQRTPRTKRKVVHHDKLKPYYPREPLDKTWVLEAAEKWHPREEQVQVAPPAVPAEADDEELMPEPPVEFRAPIADGLPAVVPDQTGGTANDGTMGQAGGGPSDMTPIEENVDLPAPQADPLENVHDLGPDLGIQTDTPPSGQSGGGQGHVGTLLGTGPDSGSEYFSADECVAEPRKRKRQPSFRTRKKRTVRARKPPKRYGDWVLD